MTTYLRARPGAIMRMAVGAVLALGASVALSAVAPETDARTFGPVNGVEITFTVPETYASCQSSGLTDTVSTSGVPANWTLRGQILVGYIGATGFVVTNTIPVNTQGDINIPINYPPHSAIDPNPAGIIEYHVSPQIEVYDQNNIKVWWIGGDITNAPGTLGPGGQDWDVFCTQPPPDTPPPPAPLAGCTPGYWKQQHHWDSYPAGVQPNTSFTSIFTQYPETASFPDVPWYFALDGGGGPGVEGALRILRRAAAAAYLNSIVLPGYGMTSAQVVAAVNQAAASNDRNTILALATQLDQRNNQGTCPLN
jgi:hypothetical protein